MASGQQKTAGQGCGSPDGAARLGGVRPRKDGQTHWMGLDG